MGIVTAKGQVVPRFAPVFAGMDVLVEFHLHYVLDAGIAIYLLKG